MTENPNRSCSRCGTAISTDAAGGLCPRCLMAMNFDSRTMPEGEEPSRTPPMSPEELAEKFPQYEILECLGRGGMGVVYKARQKSLNRIVAIKILAPEREHEPRFAERFAREAELLAKLNHPHIVTIHDFGETGGLFYLVMEFVDGVNLRDLLRDGKLEPKQALAIVPPICEALQYAHDKGIVHRDIKPENLLLDRDGRIKIADFGIAGLVGAGWENIGTPPYMAPEQSGVQGGIDHRADIYALGVVLYEMLTGERPSKDLVAPSKKVQIDVRLDEMVLRALEKSPELRYQTAGEFRTVIETMQPGPPAATPPAIPEPSPPQGMFRRWWWLFLVMIPLGLALGLAGGAVLNYVIPKKYEAQAIIEVKPQAGVQITPLFFATEFEKLKSREALAEVAKRMELENRWMLPEGEAIRVLKGIINVQNIRGTDLLNIRVRHTNAWDATGIANSLSLIYQETSANKVLVHETAVVPKHPVSPNLTLNLVLAALAGLITSPLMALLAMAVLQRLIPPRRLFARGNVRLALLVALASLGAAGGVVFILNHRSSEARSISPRLLKPPATDKDKDAARLSQEGWQLWGSGKPAEARPKFEEAVKLAPGDANAWNGLGWALFNSGNPIDAEKAFQKAIELDPKSPGGLNGLGQIYLSQRKYDQAEGLLLKAAEHRATAGMFGLARLYLLQGKFEQAEKWAQSVVDSGEVNEVAKKMLEAAKAKNLPEGLRMKIEPPAPPTAEKKTPDGRADKIAVEDLALHMIVAIREKNDAKLKSLATDSIKGWPDALPVFAVELREHFRQFTGNESFDLRASESLVEGDLAAVRCTGPAALEGKCLVLFFVKTGDGWRNHSLRNSMETMPLTQHMADFRKQVSKLPAAAQPEKNGTVSGQPADELLNADQRAVIDWTDRQFRSYFDRRTFAGMADDERADLETKLLDTLKGPETREYYLAINTLGALRTPKAALALREIAFSRLDKNNRDRWMAIRALGLMGDKAPVPEMIHLVYHGNQNTHWWAQISLVRLTGQNFGSDWKAWGEWWNKSGSQPPFNPEIIRWWNGQPEPDKLAEALNESDRKFLEGLRPRPVPPQPEKTED